jgi:DNA replication protein DnaC
VPQHERRSIGRANRSYSQPPGWPAHATALETLEHVVQQLERGQLGAIEAIEILLAEEITIRESRRVKAALQMARLATIKTLSGIDFSFQPSLDHNRILALAQLDFIDRHEVVHFIGQSGTGKSHLAAALGVEAIRAGRSVYFSPLADIIDSLAKAEREGRLRERIRFLCRSSLLIIDEIGYLTVGAGAGNLFFQLVTCRSRFGGDASQAAVRSGR